MIERLIVCLAICTAIVILVSGQALFHLWLRLADRRVRRQENAILLVLNEARLADVDGEMYGLDVARLARVSRSSVYLRLSALEDRGLVSSRLDPKETPAGVRRRLYRLRDSLATEPGP